MNIVRCGLLLMLVMLLTLRGVAAAAMPCAPAPAGHGPAEAHHAHAHDHGAAHPTHQGAQDGKSSLCAASCAASPLPAQAVPLPEPSVTMGLRFPALAAPVPTFLSDGLERPPRRI